MLAVSGGDMEHGDMKHGGIYELYADIETFTNYYAKYLGKGCFVTGSGNNTTEAGQISIWSGETGKHLSTFRGHTNTVHALDVSGSYIASGAYDHTVKLWNLSEQECLTSATLPNNVSCVKFINDKLLTVAGCHDNNLYILNDGEIVHKMSDHRCVVGCLDISYDNQTLVSGSCDFRANIWDMTTGKVRQYSYQRNRVNCVKFMDANIILSACSNGYSNCSLKLADLRIELGQEIIANIKQEANILTVAKINENMFASGGYAGNIDIWDGRNLSTPVQTIELTDKPMVTSIDVADDGTLCAGCLDCTVKLYRLV
jgi:WD40 repeat protein